MYILRYIHCIYIMQTKAEQHSPVRVAKTHRMPFLYRSFSAKKPYD